MSKKKRLTRKQAIVNFCRECMGWDGWRGGKAGTPWKKAAMMVKECSDPGCALFSYRNGSEEQKTQKTGTHTLQKVSYERPKTDERIAVNS